MAGIKRDGRLQVMLGSDELKALDVWRFDNRMPTRAAAVRELLRRGLHAHGFSTAPEDMRSGDFGILTDEPSGGNGDGHA